MKKHIFTLFSVLLLIILVSCNNPFFIKATKLYEVSFSTNGGTSIASTRTDCIKEMPFTQKTDCTFCGWYIKSDFSGEAVSFPLEVKDDITLYAKWQQMYTVSFETNGGTKIESYKTGIIEYAPDISKTDFTFIGWYTTQDFSGNPITFPYLVERPTILYAKWIQTSFLVSFETNGGTEIASYKTSLIQVAPECTRENFIFDGWYTTADYSTPRIEFPYALNANVTLYAKWIPTYQVTFYTGEGSTVAPFRTNKIETPPETFRSGFSFAGWYIDSQFTTPAVFPYTLQADTIFYAKWQAIYNVTFVTNGGTSVASLQTGYIQTSPVTTKNDNSFGGWYLDADFTEENKVTFPYTVTGDITLYAKWQPLQCTITYMPNGATEGTVPATTTVDKGSTYTIAGNTGNLTKQGFAFTKWNTRADGEGQGYSAGNTITVTGDVILYAQWGKDYGAMIYVEGGSFIQGGNGSGVEHTVTLNSFSIGQYEITYELWIEVKNWTNSQETEWNVGSAIKGVTNNDTYTDWEPATSISWYEAIAWCNAYSEMKGLSPCYYSDYTYKTVYRDVSDIGYVYWNKNANGYRLPTESEWEYAAKGGPSQKSYTYAGSNTIGNVAWYSGNSGNETHPVGTKSANSLEIYDMCGNVEEWCGTSYYDYSKDPQTNPNDWSFFQHYINGEYKRDFEKPIIRGGAWGESATSVTTRDYRSYGTDQGSYTGFRIARNTE